MLRAINTSTTHRPPHMQAHRARPAQSRAAHRSQKDATRRQYTMMSKKQIICETLDMLGEEYIHKVMIYAWTLLEIQEDKKLGKTE